MFRPICRFWQKGFCKYGDQCRYDHPSTPLPEVPPNAYTTSTKRTSSVAGFLDVPPKRIGVHQCHPPITHVYAVIRETTAVTTNVNTEVQNTTRRRIQTSTNTAIERENSREIRGVYTSIKQANFKVIILKGYESDDHIVQIKERVDSEDGCVSWSLEIDNYKVEVSIELFELDTEEDKEEVDEANTEDEEAEDDEEIEIYLGRGSDGSQGEAAEPKT